MLEKIVNYYKNVKKVLKSSRLFIIIYYRLTKDELCHPANAFFCEMVLKNNI